MKQRHINATLTITALALTTLILTALPRAGAVAPTVASLSTNPKRINESAEAHSFIRSPFVDSSPGATTRISTAPRLERQPLESLSALNGTEATERGAPVLLEQSTAVFYDDFSTDPNTSGRWSIHRLHTGDTNNEASWDSTNQVLYLTRETTWRAVAMFANYQLTTTCWEAQFRYKVGGGSGADGFVFMFYKDEVSYGEPGCGGSLGFQISNEIGVPKSDIPGYGVEFDSWLNPPSDQIGDPSSNHIALIKDSVSNHLAYTNDPRTEDNIWHDALIQFDHGHVVISIDGESVLDNILADPDYTYSGIGFSATTGAATNNHIIDNFILRVGGGPEPTPGLVYSGPLYLPADAVMVDEADGRITMGDHVHLRLPFKNTGSLSLSSVTVEMLGGQRIGSSPGVSIHNGADWRNLQTVQLTPENIGPDEIGTADFWIYVSDNDPIDRRSLDSQTWLQVRTGSGQWTIRIALSPITFAISGNEALKSGSCLHNPGNFGIQRYAQYAAGAWTMSESPTNGGDPDTPEQTIRNLVSRVYTEFSYKDGIWDVRVPDVTLLSTRHGDIGVCRDYADLTTGLLRALGLPSRYTDAIFTKHRPFWFDETVGHAWVEAYLNAGGWRQADSTWNSAFEERVYENAGLRVKEVWADRYPLSSATIWVGRQYQCISSCYEAPVDCPSCFQDSNGFRFPWPWPNLSCVEDVTSRYHESGLSGLRLAADERLLILIQAPTFVTYTVPFTLTTGIVNSTTISLNVITATVAISEYVNSMIPLFDVTPPYQVITDVNPSQTITVTWAITPLVTGSGIPLRVAAESGDFFEVVEQPLVVNELGTLPDLSLSGVCGLGTTSPGKAITLTASILDESLQPLTDPATLVTATAYATPTLLFSTTVNLPYCETCEMYRSVVNLPDTAPIGNYQVDFVATHPSYDSDEATTFFFVTPPLSLTLTTNRDVLEVQDTLTITVEVSDRGTVITEANVLAEISTPGGIVTAPLMIESGDLYTLVFRPADLAPNLDGEVLPGTWQIAVKANYSGGTGTVYTSICTLVGDFDGSGRVDVADIMEVANRWRCRKGEGCYDERYDLDKDGDIDIVDIMLVVVHWGETCE